MKKVLGLDLGVNSIGWALIEENNGRLHNIIAMGSRIIPEKDEHRDFEKGNDISKNAARRQKRGMRRLNERYKLRRNNLILLCKTLGIIPSGLKPLFDRITVQGYKLIIPHAVYSNGDPQYKPHELYELRTKALIEKVSLEDLFRIIYHLNQRRGFKSNKKANNPEEIDKENNIINDKEKKVETSVEKVKIQNVELTGEKKGKKQKDVFKVTLDDGRFALTDKYIFKKFEGDKTILEIKKEILKTSPEPKYTFSFPSKWQRNRKELNDAIIKIGGYPGKYFYEEYLKAKKEKRLYEFRVRENVVNRELYEKEFQAIWNKQHEIWNKEGVDINYLPRFKDAIEQIVPANNKEEKQKWILKGLGDFIKNYIVYYQRDLKSQIKTIGDCRFEEKYYEKIDEETGEIIRERSGPKCCPKSHPLFQEFRIWQQINNLVAYDELEEEVELREDLMVDLFYFLNRKEEAEISDKKNEILKFLKKNSEDIFSINSTKSWVGNRTLYFFKKIFNSNGYNDSHILNDKEKFWKLWHLLYSVGDEKGIRTGLRKIDKNLPEEIIKTFCEVDFKEKQYSSLSLKAIKNLLPLMKTGSFFNKNEFTETTIKRIEQFLNDELESEFDERTFKKLKQKTNINEFNGLSYYQAASLIYGKHTAKQEERYVSPEDILPVPRHSLRNPVVEQIVNETLMLVKDLWLKDPELKDGEIRIELSRELKSNKDERKRLSESQDRNKEANKEIIEEIRRHKGKNYNVSLSEIEKVKLWKEAGGRSPYTGKVLNISEILSSYTEIEHIIPRTRYYNDGLINKTICESHINADKDKMTSYEYMTSGTKCQNEKLSYEEFIQFIKRFYKPKIRIFTLKEIPDDFIERQKKDTQYIATRIKEELGKVVGIKNVKSTTGQVTNYLKEQWGVAELMRRLLKPRFELLQKEYGVELVKEEEIIGDNSKPTGKKRTIIKGFSKRFDHRHHAIDALIIACTRQGIIQQLNLLNKITKGKTKQIEETIGNSLRKFIPPTGKEDIYASKFYQMVEDSVYSIIISYKNRKRLVSKGVNWYQKFISEKNRIAKVKQDNTNLWAIKGELHKQTNYGIITYDGAFRYTSRCKLSDLTENKIKNIPSMTLREEIQDHLAKPEYEKDIKKAFGPEGIIDFNKERKNPVFSITVMEDGEVEKVSGKTFLYDAERKLAVEKGGNYCVSVYEHPESIVRKFDVVSFFDAVQLKTSGEDPFQTDKGLEFEKEGYKMIFTLTHFDLVYVPLPEEDIELLAWSDKKKISERIYRVVKFSGTTLYFQPHNFAHEITVHKGKANNASQHKGEFGYNTNGTQYLIGTNQLIRNTCIKLNIDRLGNINPAI